MHYPLKDILPTGNTFSRVAVKVYFMGGLDEVMRIYRTSGAAGLLREPNLGRKTLDCLLAVLCHLGLIEEETAFISNRKLFEQYKAILKEHDNA